MDVRLKTLEYCSTKVDTDLNCYTPGAMNEQTSVQDGFLTLSTTTLTQIKTFAINQELVGDSTRVLLLEITNCCLLPLVFVFGLIGNSLSLIVLTCKMKNMTTSTILLVGLTVSDLGYLVTTFMRKSSCLASKLDAVRGPWLDIIFLPQVYMLNRVFGLVTAFITMVIAIERWLAIYFPLKVGIIVTKTRTKLVVLAVYTLSFGVLCPFFFIYEIWWTPGSVNALLVPKVRETKFFQENRQGLIVYNNIFLSNILVFLPIAVVCACSVMVVHRTTTSLRWRLSVQRSDVNENQIKNKIDFNQHEKNVFYTSTSDPRLEISLKCQVVQTKDKKNSSFEGKDTINNKSFPVNKPKNKSLQRRKPVKRQSNFSMEGNKRMTRMLLIVAISYVVCNIPTSVSTVVNLIDPNFSSFSGRYTNVFLVVSGFTILLQCVNSSFNFVIYVANSSRLGKSFRRMLASPFSTSKK